MLDIQGLNLRLDADMTRVSPSFIAEFAAEIDRPDADAIFMSCGALRSLEVIDQIEQAAGKPAVASNQAMIWDVFRLAGIDDQFAGFGSLFRHH